MTNKKAKIEELDELCKNAKVTHVTWMATSFSSVLSGHKGIQWIKDKLVRQGNEVCYKKSIECVYDNELDPDLQSRLNHIIQISNAVNEEIQSILDEHLKRAAADV